METKYCNKCRKTKPLSEFQKCSRNKSGLQTYCRECRNLAKRKYNKENRHVYENYYNNNKHRILENTKKYKEEHKEFFKQYDKEYREQNNQKIKEYKHKHYLKNKEKYYEKTRKWKKENPGMVNQNTAKRRAKKLNATPKWLTKAQLAEMADIYKQAKELEAIFFNRKFQVDHIIPLRGKEVCGLNVPWNLQILTAEENIKKGNKL